MANLFHNISKQLVLSQLALGFFISEIFSQDLLLGCISNKLLNFIAGSVIQEKEEEFTLSLYALQQQPQFNLMLFEREIDKIRLCVAEVMQPYQYTNFFLRKDVQIIKSILTLFFLTVSAFVETCC